MTHAKAFFLTCQSKGKLDGESSPRGAVSLFVDVDDGGDRALKAF
jgi:hypothetical protein